MYSSKKNSFFSIFASFFSAIPFLAFFTFLLYLWLWNTFGKTVLIIEKEKVTIIKERKLFTKPQVYFKSKVGKVFCKNFKVEKSKYYTRINFSLSGSLNSIIFEINGYENRIIDWLTQSKADEIVDTINKIWKK